MYSSSVLAGNLHVHVFSVRLRGAGIPGVLFHRWSCDSPGSERLSPINSCFAPTCALTGFASLTLSKL